ncbi:MAG: PEP-CTERM sorting domain-containing protein [Burkholderiales bacterium]|nr:PEP-CTERM sorting domain-containing protein [Opitutaceae bacterium]
MNKQNLATSTRLPAARLLALAALAASAGSLSAQTSTWTGAGTNWSSNANPGWNTTGVPNAVGATANIAGATGNITVNGAYTIGTLIAGGTYNGRTLATSSGNLTFDVSSGNALLDLSNGGLTSGGMTVATALTLNDTLEVRSFVNSGSTTSNFTGAISGSGQLLFVNSGTGTDSRIELRNTSNSFGSLGLGFGSGVRLFGSGTMGSGQVTFIGPTPNKTLTFMATSAGGADVQTHSNNIDLGTANTNGNGLLNIQSTSIITLNGVISGSGSSRVANLNGGTLILGGASPNTSTIVFRSDTHGTVIADKVDAIEGGIQLRSSAAGATSALLVGVTDTINGVVSVEGNGSGAGFAYLAKIGLKDGNNGTVTFNNATKINLNNAFGIGGTALVPTTSLNLHSGNGTGALVVSTEIGTNNPNARNISITGTGRVNLNRATGNTYLGTTTVSSGTLLANNTSGSATSTGAVTVASGATLGGSGFIAGVTTVASGGFLAPGNSPGNLTFNNGLTLAGTYNWELAALSTASPGVNFDTITVTSGAVDITGASMSLNLGAFAPSAVAFWQTDQTWTGIINNTGAGSIAGTFAAIDNSAWASLGSFSTFVTNGGAAGADVNLVWTTAIPEPSSFAALAGLGALGFIATRRRQHAKSRA